MSHLSNLSNRAISAERPRIVRWALSLVAGIAILLTAFGAASAAAAPTTMVNLGQASSYAAFSGASIANTVSAPGAPHTTIRGDLGVKANAEPSGFPPGVVTGNIRYGGPAEPAHADLSAAYAEIAGRQGGAPLAGALVGVTVTPGLYTITGAASNTGTLTLDGGGNPNAVFVFQVNGALSFAAASQVVLTNGAQASRVFWQVNGAGAVGALGSFAGTLIAKDAVAMGNGTLVNGRAFARDGAMTLDNNQFYGGPPIVTIDGGSSAQTTDSSPTITGTTDVEAPSTVSVTIAGQTLAATPSGGVWSVDPGVLPNGTYPVVASVMDAAGNQGSGTQQLTIDTVLPLIALDGGASVSTNDPTPTIAGTSDADEDTVVRVTVGSQNLRALTDAAGSWNVRSGTLTDGPHAVTAAASDLAGNESTASQTITVDTTAPSLTITGGASALTSDSTPVISGMAGVAAGRTVTVTVANDVLTGSVGAGGAWSVTASTLSDGPHRIAVWVEDSAGNRAETTQTLTVDTVAPKVTITGGANARTTRTDPTIAGTSDAAPGSTVHVSVAGKSMTALLQANGSWNTNAGRVGNGTWTVKASVQDPAGNLGTASQTLIIGPASGVVPNPDPTDDRPVITRLTVTPKKARSLLRVKPAIKVSITEAAKVAFRITRKSTKAKRFKTTVPAGTSTVRIPKKIRKTLKPGSYRLTAMATDSAGQSSASMKTSFKLVR